MHLSLKRELDTYLGVPLLSVLNALTRLLGFLLKRNHSVDPVRSILIMKFQGMGSVAIALPALLELKKMRPEARIIFWGSKETVLLAKNFTEVFDETWVLEDRNIFSFTLSLARGVLRSLKLRLDWAFDLEVYSKLSSVILTLTSARNRGGFAVESVRLRKGCHTHLLFFNRTKFLGEAYGRLLALCHPAPRPGDLSLPRAIRSPDHPSVTPPWKKLSQDNRWKDRSFGILHLPVGELATERSWTIDHAVRFAKKVLKETEHEIFLTGYGKSDEMLVQGFLENFPNEKRIHSLVSKLDLSELISLISHSKFVVSPDTGVLHLSRICRSVIDETPIRVVGLFGPTRALTYFGENTSSSHALEIGLYCSPCVHYWPKAPCGGAKPCMKGISGEEVWITLNKLLSKNSIPENRKIDFIEKPDFTSGYVPGLIHSRDGHSRDG